MSNIPTIDTPREFAAYAQNKVELWQTVIGELVNHIIFGVGIIERVESGLGIIYLDIRFDNDEVESRKFTSEAFNKVRFFTNMEVWSGLPGLEVIRQRLRDQLFQEGVRRVDNERRRIEQQRLLQQKLREQREEQCKIERVRQQQKDQQRRVEEQRRRDVQQRKIEEQIRRAEEEQRKNQERAHREAEKQALLVELREYFEQDFLSAYDFYQSQCSAYISHEEYEAEKLALVQSWVRQHLGSNADSQQAIAIGAVESHVQVIARAGSGKTTTLVNRALFLQQRCGVSPHEMLLLAFNRKAAEEMSERLAKKTQGVVSHTMTFHALAHGLVHPEEAILFDEPDGEQTKSRVIQSLIDDYIRTEDGYENIRQLMMSHFREDWEHIALGGYHKNRDDMLQYRRSLPKEGIDGAYLKSFGEKVIADFLFEHDIKYRYERNFWWNGLNYRPDFTIFTGENQGVIIEYFGLKGDPDYDKLSEQKHDYWRNKPGWYLLEFSPDDLKKEGVEGFRTRLQDSLEDYGITCSRLSEDEVWYRIKERAIDRFTKVVVGFVGRCRKLSLAPEQLAEIVSKHTCSSEIEQRFLSLVQTFYKMYLERLQATGEEDFDGLLQQAAERVIAGQTVFARKAGRGDLQQLRFIFIDEYQDFSELFYNLIVAIRSQNSHAQFFCVGDDWQAINGFAGSDLRFYQDFATIFQPSQRLYITTNYRSATSIVHVSNTLMSQSGTPARAYNKTAGSVVVADLGKFEPTPKEKDEHPGDNLTPAVLRLVNKTIMAGKEVVLLSRKNSLPWYVNYGDRRNVTRGTTLDTFLKLVREHLPQSERNKVSISTAHKYKGLEKHTVIVLDAVPRCYPLIHPDLMFTRVLGDTIERTIAEDRRLFYVALTRAVEQLVLITEKNNVSPFLEDLRGNTSISRFNWSDYPPVIGTTQRITVRVGNQEGKNGNGTYAIKKMLKDEGYEWASTKWQHWWRTIPVNRFSVEQLVAQASWSRIADGIEVRLYDDVDNMIAVYRVNKGQWICLINKISG